MSRPMTFQEFGNLLKDIANKHSPFTAKPGYPSIKYVDPHMDMRTNSVFSLTLRGFGAEDKVFHTQNECRDLPQTLEERVREYLETPLIHSQLVIPPGAAGFVQAPSGYIC